MTPILLAPVLHGAVGLWDEVLNVVPIVMGIFLLTYFYFDSRRRRSEEKKDRDGEG